MSLSPSDKYTPGSLPSWPLNTPLSCLLQQDLPHSPSFMGSRSAPQSPSLNHPSPLLNSPPLLSSPASMGASTAKVAKRKSRAVNKPSIRVLSADRATFRDVVQKLTGIPTSPSVHGSRHLWGAGNMSGISRPLVARPAGSHSDLMATAHQSMPTLDTSSPYLSRGYSSNNMVYNEVGKSRFNSPYEANFDPSVRSGLNFDQSGGVGNFDLNGGVIMPGRYIEGGMGMAMDMDMESLRRLHRASELESLLLGSNKFEDVLQSNKVDHWLSSDLLRTPSPKVEAHSF